MGKLKEQMLEEMKLRNLSEKTVKSYILQMELYTKKFGISPTELGEAEIRTYMRYMREEKKLSASSINVAYCALKFFTHRYFIANSEWRRFPVLKKKKSCQ